MISTKIRNVIQVFTQLRLKETFQTVPVESSRMFQNSDSLISEIPHASDTTGAVITEGHTPKNCRIIPNQIDHDTFILSQILSHHIISYFSFMINMKD